MRKPWIAIAMLFAASACSALVENSQAEYLGGTVPSIKTGAIGQFDLSSPSQLSFQSPAGSFSIPYAAITSYQFSQEVTHHLGVAPAIAVGLIKKRQRQHFLRISYLDGNNVAQGVVFEVAKQMPRTLLAVLETKAPQGCKPVGGCPKRNY
jgi:hypothetical protein